MVQVIKAIVPFYFYIKGEGKRKVRTLIFRKFLKKFAESKTLRVIPGHREMRGANRDALIRKEKSTLAAFLKVGG